MISFFENIYGQKIQEMFLERIIFSLKICEILLYKIRCIYDVRKLKRWNNNLFKFLILKCFASILQFWDNVKNPREINLKESLFYDLRAAKHGNKIEFETIILKCFAMFF